MNKTGFQKERLNLADIQLIALSGFEELKYHTENTETLYLEYKNELICSSCVENP